MDSNKNRRILLIDDNAAIHEDFRKILGARNASDAVVDEASAAFFGESTPQLATQSGYELASAYQGEEAVALATKSIQAGSPYAMAFVDVRMPPGLDGLETIQRLWQVDPQLQAVICTAFSDYSFEETIAKLGNSDRLLILKKPFDPVEVLQMAGALTEKWNLTRAAQANLEAVQRAEQEARAYSASLETVNFALKSEKAMADAQCREKSEFLGAVAKALRAPAGSIVTTCASAVQSIGESHAAARALRSIEQDGRELASSLSYCESLALLDVDKLGLERKRCSLGALVQQALDEHAASGCTARGPSVELRNPVPEYVQSDADSVRGMLVSLLEYARAHAGERELCIELGMDKHESSGPRLLCISVRGARVAPPALAASEHRLALEGAPDSALGLFLMMAHRLARRLGGALRIEPGPAGALDFRLMLEPGPLGDVRMIGCWQDFSAQRRAA
jgi:CheY-like chemotaxis protein